MPSHAHVLDPSWSLEPVPWAPHADTTMLPRFHAAVIDECEGCVAELSDEAVVHTETTAVVVAMALSVAKGIPPQLLPGLKGVVPFEPPMILMLERAVAAGDKLTSTEVLSMVGEMDAGDRASVFRGCVGMLDLYTQIMRGDEPGE
jgi:hypothetical protein